MMCRPYFTTEDAAQIGASPGVTRECYDVGQLRMGLDIDLEHGHADPDTDVTHDSRLSPGKLAHVHSSEFSDYCSLCLNGVKHLLVTDDRGNLCGLSTFNGLRYPFGFGLRHGVGYRPRTGRHALDWR